MKTATYVIDNKHLIKMNKERRLLMSKKKS
jgi:hypothetical protein